MACQASLAMSSPENHIATSQKLPKMTLRKILGVFPQGQTCQHSIEAPGLISKAETRAVMMMKKAPLTMVAPKIMNEWWLPKYREACEFYEREKEAQTK
jgi:hypothetical protein